MVLDRWGKGSSSDNKEATLFNSLGLELVENELPEQLNFFTENLRLHVLKISRDLTFNKLTKIIEPTFRNPDEGGVLVATAVYRNGQKV